MRASRSSSFSLLGFVSLSLFTLRHIGPFEDLGSSANVFLPPSPPFFLSFLPGILKSYLGDTLWAWAADSGLAALAASRLSEWLLPSLVSGGATTVNSTKSTFPDPIKPSYSTKFIKSVQQRSTSASQGRRRFAVVLS
ncbi:hypothetical protein C8Q78DRAFT_361441 [Trametes maxima]|nr:hypothetical protein C8Q78DRAFT_361441 [Trametes maxima]